MPATPPSVEIRLTPAQLKALMFLPADGAMAIKVGGMDALLWELRKLHPELCEGSYDRNGPRGGWCWGYRLTPAGIAERKKREGAG